MASGVHELQFNRAEVQWRGFSEIHSRDENHPATPDSSNVVERPPWRTAVEGWYTRYGDVGPVVAKADGKVVLLNGGDVLTLHVLATGLPTVPQNASRTFLLYSVGWNKEGDPNTVGGEQVLPLPGNAGTETRVSSGEDRGDDWQLRYNTRWVAHDHSHPAKTAK